MRQMVLNHASVYAPNARLEDVLAWLADLAEGIAELVSRRVVESAWRMCNALELTPCLTDYSLADAIWKMQASGHREASRYLLRLATKTPLLSEVTKEIESRFWGCETQSLPAEQGKPLLLCAIADCVAVGLPSNCTWDRDQLTVEFDELLPDESLKRVSEDIDNLTRSIHANAIQRRHSERLAWGSDPESLWANREQAFPSLQFGPGVERNLKDQATDLTTIVGKLVQLDRAAEAWKVKKGAAPSWPIMVTDEASLKPQHLQKRSFLSQQGTHKLFTWHARFGSGGRIHLRFDATTQEVEIGYIGPHLPLSD